MMLVSKERENCKVDDSHNQHHHFAGLLHIYRACIGGRTHRACTKNVWHCSVTTAKQDPLHPASITNSRRCKTKKAKKNIAEMPAKGASNGKTTSSPKLGISQDSPGSGAVSIHTYVFSTVTHSWSTKYIRLEYCAILTTKQHPYTYTRGGPSHPIAMIASLFKAPRQQLPCETVRRGHFTVG